MIVIWEDNRGLEGIRFFFGHERISHNDDGVAYMHEVCCGSVDAYAAAPLFAGYDIGFDACTVGIIHDLHFFACVDIGCLH